MNQVEVVSMVEVAVSKNRLALVLGLLVLALAPACRERTRHSAAQLEVPAIGLDFGATAITNPRTALLTLTNSGRSPFTVYSVKVEGVGLSMEPFGPFKVEAGGPVHLPVTFSPSAEGEMTGVLTLEHDADNVNDNGVTVVKVSGRGVKTLVSVNTELLDFGSVELGTTRDLEVELVNAGPTEAPFRFDLEGEDAAAFTAPGTGEELHLAAGEVRKVPVTFNPARIAAARASLRVLVCPTCEPQFVDLIGFGIHSALEINPTRVTFGRVNLGARAESVVNVTNAGSEAIQLDGAVWKGASGFDIVSAPTRLLHPGQTEQIVVAFAPRNLGAVPTALLEVRAQAPGAKGFPVLPVSGEAGTSCVVVAPKKMDFGMVPQGMSAVQELELLNRCASPVTVANLQVTTSTGGFFGLGQLSQSLPLPAGQWTKLKLAFTPKPNASQSVGKLTFQVAEGQGYAREEVELRGESRVFAPCRFRWVPPAISMGSTAVGSSVSMGVALRNEGNDDCFVAGLQIASGSDSAFTTGSFKPTRVGPGQKAAVKLTFKPTASGAYSGLVEAWVNSTTDGHPMLPVSGTAINSCLVLAPASVDFGTTQLACAPRNRALLVKNSCSSPVTLNAATLSHATGDTGELTVNPGVLPATLPPGGELSLDITYEPLDEGLDSAGLELDTSEGRQLAGLTGEGVTQPMVTKRFFQESQGKVDLLFVIDNSGSMMEEQRSLGQNFAALLNEAQRNGIDYHIGVTTTGLIPSPGGWSLCPGGVDGGENGRLFPADGSATRVITPQTPNPAGVFAKNVQVGWCHWNEQGLEAAFRALSPPLVNAADDPRTPLANDGNGDFLRADAKLGVIVVSDEEDFSPQPVSAYISFFQRLKPDPSMVSLSAIVGPAEVGTCPSASSPGSRYAEVANATGGRLESICTQNWSAALKALSSTTFGPKRTFELDEVPADPTEIKVFVDGVAITRGWKYEPGNTSIVFDAESAPHAGSMIEVVYRVSCE
jgi:hypothetical protein